MVVVNELNNTHSKTIIQRLQVKSSSTSSSSNVNTQRHSTSSLDEQFLLKYSQNDTQPVIIQYNSAIAINLNVEEPEEDEIKQINRNQEFTTDQSVKANITSYLNLFNISPSPSSSSSSSSSASATAINNQTKTNLDETTATITTAHSDETAERNNSMSSTSNGSDDLDDLVISKDAIREEDEYILTDDEDELLDSDQLKLNSSKSNIIEEDEYEEVKTDIILNCNNHSELPKSSSSTELNCNKPFNSLSPYSLACEVASLSSLTSNYSQFDFLNNRASPPPQPILSTTSTSSAVKVTSVPKSSSSLTSFFFSNSLFNKKSLQNNTSNIHSSNNSTLDLITSKLLNLKSTPSTTFKNNDTKSKTYINNSSSSSSSSSQLENDKHSIKSNQSANNLCMNINSNLQVPSSVLIFENRPSNLPAKSHHEAIKHKQEYEKMVEIAKKKELKEKELKLKKYEQQLKKEDFLANSLQIWNNEILKNWNELKNAKRTQQLWWHGLPPSIRGKVWRLAIGNDLNLTKETFLFYEKKAQEKLEQISRNPESASTSSVELIKLDVSRTFPQLCFFQSDGPLHNALHSVLGAYACYNTKIGYVQGMSFLTAILLLNMEAADAFICLSNLLNTKYLLACFCMDQAKMNRYFRIHEILFEHNIPKLFRHFEEQKVKPDLYLIEWIFTLFSKSLNIEATSRIWDIFFRDHEEFLFRAALGILSMFKETLIQMDFIHIVQFLTKLPENINTTQLFKSIELINTSIDDVYLTFKHLIDEVINSPLSTNHSING